jgi:hypothetical protein
MLTSKLNLVQNVVQSGLKFPQKSVEYQRVLIAAMDLSEPPKTGRPQDAPLRRTLTITEGLYTRNKGTASSRSSQGVFGIVLHK